MTELQQNRYDQLLRKVGDLKGPGSKVSEVLTELFPTFDVENLPAELIRLSGARLCWGGGNITAVALEVPTGILANPAGSGKLLTVTDVHFAADGAGRAVWGVTNTIRGTAISTQQFRDTRDIPPNLPTGVIRQIAVAATAVATNQSRILALVDLQLSDPAGIAVLAPGTAMEVGVTTILTNLSYSFAWKERAAEPSELRD